MVVKLNGKPISNKQETLPEKPRTPPLSSLPTIETNTSPAPFIDKLSVVLTPPSDKEGHEIYTSLMSSMDDKPQKPGSSDGTFIDAGSGAKWGKFKWAKRIPLDSIVDVKKYPLLQCAHGGKIVTDLRIEFVPVDLGAQGMKELRMQLGGLLDGGWDYIVKHGKITRIDISVDFPDRAADDFCFLPVQATTSTEWRTDGKLTGYTYGKPGGNQTLIYDRGEKRKKQKKSWKGKEGVRVERRIRQPAANTLSKLPEFPNPFAGMSFVGMPGPPPEGQKSMHYVWDLFKCAVEVEGLSAALALLPEEKRTLYRAHLKAHANSWWDPAAIWQKWPTMLEKLKIT